MTFTTRFAPSPTGPLHLGHAYSALLAHDMAKAAEGVFLLRIEDIDQSRARTRWEEQIYDDLAWLGLHWPEPVLRQSGNTAAYKKALNKLWDLGVLFPCFCARKDIRAAMAAPQEGQFPVYGPDGLIYPGTCRERPRNSDQSHEAAIRLNMGKSLKMLSEQGVNTFSFEEIGDRSKGDLIFSADELTATVGDVVLARRDMGTSYHLSVVIDDAAQKITHVVRGEDLLDATKIHVVLQKLLQLETPVYCHHKLIRDETGKRLAKRDDARAISTYRAEGLLPQDIRELVGLAPVSTPAS